MSVGDDEAWLNPPPPKPGPAEPEISAHDTIVPRHLAASLDNTLSIIASLVCAKAVPDAWPAIQAVVFIAVFPGYFLLQEALFSRTLGKFCMGLIVVQYDGRRCTWRQAIIRTLFRFVEVNPLLLGALPAAISIIGSRHRQRFGDKVARTIVVPARRVP
jgi:uncharacterized RDD family membrane protein YckC